MPDDQEQTEALKEKLSRKGFRRRVERELLKAAPTITPKFFTSLEKAVEKGDKWAMELTARILALDSSRAGITITNQIANSNQQAQDSGRRPMGMESILASIEKRERQAKQLPAGEVVDVSSAD